MFTPERLDWARAFLTEWGGEKLATAVDIYEAELASRENNEYGGLDAGTAFDMVHRLLKKGGLSPKALGYLAALVERIEAHNVRKAQWAAEAEVAEPLPVPTEGKRIDVAGEVLSIKERYTYNGSSWKMVVKSDDGWKVWGTVPSSVLSQLKAGDHIKFTATVKPSATDNKFGFFSRPSKAVILSA